MPHHDLVIIGTGSGNSLVTPELEGLDIAIIEEASYFGGTCLNVGCIPTKMFVLPADRVVEAADAARLGVSLGAATVDWPSIRDRIFGRIDPISAGGEEYRRSQDFVTLYRQHAEFVGERTLRLADGTEVSGDQVVVAAGSRAIGLPVPGLEYPDPDRGLHTSDTIMRLEQLPKRMLVIGGGYVGCEMAHVFAGLGVEITQVQRSDVLLSHEERAVAERYTEVASARMDVRTSTTISRAEHADDGWRVDVVGPDGVAETLTAEVVLLAVGRVPNGERLGVERGGIDLDDDGYVVVDDEQRTTAPGTWALGDVCSHWQLKHVANHEARVVAHNLAVTLGRLDASPQHSDHRFVPHAVFGHPQVAAFGPTTQQLEDAQTPFVSYTQRYADVAYGWALEDVEGFLTVHASPDGDILAGHMIGTMSSSLIQPLIQAASFGQKAHDVARGQYWIHPALAEVLENALLGLRQP